MYTKAYNRLAAGRVYFGEFDPFGDFDMIFGSAKLSLKIVEIPVHYKTRVGESKITGKTWPAIKLGARMIMFILKERIVWNRQKN